PPGSARAAPRPAARRGSCHEVSDTPATRRGARPPRPSPATLWQVPPRRAPAERLLAAAARPPRRARTGRATIGGMSETTKDQQAPRALWAERQGEPVYIARNERGAEVRIGRGDAEGVFSPGELLKIALATCTALSADHVLRSRLGDDFPAVVGVSSTGAEGENRYGHLDVEP